jgi:hypothetical protein
LPSRKKHITRTFRISEEYDNVLKDESASLGNSVNSLIDTIIGKYVYNDRFYKNSQLLSMAPNTVSSLLMMLSNEEVVKAGKLAGGTQGRDNLLTRGMKMDFVSVKWFIEEIMGKYAGWYTSNYYEMKSVHMFHLRHTLDKKWSLFLGSYLEEMVSNILDLDVEAVISDNTVTLRIPIIE